MRRRDFLKNTTGAIVLASSGARTLARTEPRGLAVMAPTGSDHAPRPFRLYCDASRRGGLPRAACDPIGVDRAIARRFAEAGLISPSAVDCVHEIRNHPLLDVVDRPVPDADHLDRAAFLAAIRGSLEAHGQAFLVPEGNGWDWRSEGQSRKKKGPPEWLWLLDPARVVPLREPGSPAVKAYRYSPDKDHRSEISPDAMILLQGSAFRTSDRTIAEAFTRLVRRWDARLFFAFDAEAT